MSEACKWGPGQATQHKADKGPEILCNHGTTDHQRGRDGKIYVYIEREMGRERECVCVLE